MRFELVTPELIQTRESLGLVKDVYDPAISVKEPLSAYQTMLDLIHQDPTLATAYKITANFLTYRGFDFIGGNKTVRDKLRNQFEELDFKRVMHNLSYSLCYYGDAFLELRKNDSSSPNELWVLETTEMRIMYDSHGKVTGYVQRPFSLSGLTEQEVLAKEGTPEEPVQGIFFGPEEIIHFRMVWIGSQVYSYNPNESIAVPAATKLRATNYLLKIFENMPPRYVAHLAGINQTEYGKAKIEFQATKTNYNRVIAFSRSSNADSKLQLQKIDPPYDKELIEIIKWLNNEILKITLVPRTWVEKEGTENRGVGEQLNLPFDVNIKTIHSVVFEPQINRYLLPALGYTKKVSGSSVKFRFNEVSRKGEKEILENAGLIMQFGLKPEALVRYLDERGILGFDPNDFDVEKLEKDHDAAPSRKGMDKSTDNMTSKLDQDGTSSAGKKKLESVA